MGLNLEAGSSILQSSSVHSCGVNAIDIAGDDLVITGGDDGAISVVNRDKVTTFRHRHSGQISGLKVITSGKIQALLFKHFWGVRAAVLATALLILNSINKGPTQKGQTLSNKCMKSLLSNYYYKIKRIQNFISCCLCLKNANELITKLGIRWKKCHILLMSTYWLMYTYLLHMTIHCHILETPDYSFLEESARNFKGQRLILFFSLQI